MTTAQAHLGDVPMWIDGQSTSAESGEWIDVLDPSDASLIGRVPDGSVVDIDRAATAARRAFGDGSWSRALPADRAAALLRIADLLAAHADEFAELEARNTGKTLRMARDFDVAGSVDNIRFFAGAARNLEGRAAGEYMPGITSVLRREPIGVVGSIAPWNYPLQMAVWKIFPAIGAGNSVVLKPASLTPLTALRLAELVTQAGVPDGVLNVVTGRGERVGPALVGHREVDMVSLTGDTATGVEIIRNAAAGLKRLHLELGGKAPFVVFADADLEAAANGAVAGGFINVGQDCTAATRLYVQRPAYARFRELLLERVATVAVGRPLDDATDLGPLISGANATGWPRSSIAPVWRGRRSRQGVGRPTTPDLLLARSTCPPSSRARGRTPRSPSARYSGPCLCSCRSRTRRKPCASQTTSTSDLPRPSGRRTCSARCGWRATSTSERCG